MIHRRKFLALSTTGTFLLTSGALSASNIFSSASSALRFKDVYKGKIKLVLCGNLDKTLHLVNHCAFGNNHIEVVATIGKKTSISLSTPHFANIDAFFKSEIQCDTLFMLGQLHTEKELAKILGKNLDLWLDRPCSLITDVEQSLDKIANSNNQKMWFIYLQNNQLNFQPSVNHEPCIIA